MGKFSVSIPDDLEARLRDYAQEHHTPLSQVVAEALQGFFSPPPPPQPQPPPGLHSVQAYVTTVARSVDQIRRVLESLGLTGTPWPGGPTLPPPLPCPPWDSEQPS